MHRGAPPSACLSTFSFPSHSRLVPLPLLPPQDRPLLSEGGLAQARAVVAFFYSRLLTKEEVAHIVGRAPKVPRRSRLATLCWCCWPAPRCHRGHVPWYTAVRRAAGQGWAVMQGPAPLVTSANVLQHNPHGQAAAWRWPDPIHPLVRLPARRTHPTRPPAHLPALLPSNPMQVLVYSPTSLALKWFYLEEGLGGSGRDVVTCPDFLTARLETVGGSGELPGGHACVEL